MLGWFGVLKKRESGISEGKNAGKKGEGFFGDLHNIKVIKNSHKMVLQ
jgi:hypothetical protein